MTRKTAVQLIKTARRPKDTGWFASLSEYDRKYVMTIIRELRKDPSVPILPVARLLKEELGLSLSTETIRKTLREMIVNDKT